MDKPEDEVARMPMWKSYLYHLQQQAPKPKRIVSQREITNKPPFYGREYHGAISREDTDFLLTIGGEGSYLIRESQRAPGQYTLAIRFDGTTKNFKLYYDGQHYVGEKRFDTVQDLVADGLITFYLESKAADYIAQLSNQSNYAESPYVAYNTLKKKQLAAPRTGTRSKHRHHHHHHHKTGEKQGEGEAGGQGHNNRAERSERSPSAGADGNRVSKKTSANIPVESRVSQILENRQDANLNISVSKEGAAQTSGQVGGNVAAVAPGKVGNVEATQSSQPVAEGNRAVHSKAPESTSKEHHDYANQTQINLHRQSHLEAQARREQEALARKQQHQQQTEASAPTATTGLAPHTHNAQGGGAAARHTHLGSPSGSSPDEVEGQDVGRVTSSTNTDGPPKRASLPAKVDIERQKREILEMKKRHNFKMLEDSHVVSPPSSPVPLLDHLKFGNVNWCTDFLEVLGSEKPHNFKQTTFKGPHWCDFCANFLWGLIAQGVKCQDCGFNAHKKCSEKVPNDCMPDMKYVKRMFGVDLTTLVKAQNTLIPAVVEKCITEIESRGVESEGLYRVAGFHDDVEAIKMTFDKDGEFTDISEERYDDINTITSLLKLYFRLLPIPLITFDVYFTVIDIVKQQNLNHDQKLEQLRVSLQQLPPAHYHTVKYLMAHLHRVTEKQQKNMMNPENLAIVFAPTLLRSPENDPLSGLTAVKFERELIEILISHHSIVFE